MEVVLPFSRLDLFDSSLKVFYWWVNQGPAILYIDSIANDSPCGWTDVFTTPMLLNSSIDAKHECGGDL